MMIDSFYNSHKLTIWIRNHDRKLVFYLMTKDKPFLKHYMPRIKKIGVPIDRTFWEQLRILKAEQSMAHIYIYNTYKHIHFLPEMSKATQFDKENIL